MLVYQRVDAPFFFSNDSLLPRFPAGLAVVKSQTAAGAIPIIPPRPRQMVAKAGQKLEPNEVNLPSGKLT